MELYDLVTVVIAVFSAILAVVALAFEVRRSRIALQADLLLRLDERFFGSDMLRTRRAAAKKLLAKERPNYELGDILGFFATVAMLLERKAIDTDLTYDVFEYWIVRYWNSAKEHVAGERKYDPESYLSLERLVDRLVPLRTKSNQPPLTDEECTRFLREEARSDR